MNTFTPNTIGVDPLNITDESPVNNSVIHDLTPVLYFTITSSTSLSMNYTVFWGNSTKNLTEVVVRVNGVSNGMVNHVFSNASNYTTYYWSVNLTDSAGNWYNESYVFSIISGVLVVSNSDYSMGMVMAYGGGFLLIGLIFGMIVFKKRKKNNNGGMRY